MNEFSQSTLEKLGYYVYCLLDPRDNKIFYVGKGKGNRVFSHIKGAVENSSENEKISLIEEIEHEGRQVEHFIIRHNIDEGTAFEIESTIIDLLTFQKFEHLSSITNIMSGHASWDRGIKTVNDIEALYAVQPLNENNITHKVMIININRTYIPGIDPYEATRKFWRINLIKAKEVEYVLSEFRGIIRAIYKPIEWKKHPKDNRYYFEGEKVDSIEITQKYLNKAVQSKQRGAANPIRYLPN